MSIDTRKPYHELLASVQCTGDWRYRRPQIMAKRQTRQFVINLHLTNIIGEKFIERLSPSDKINRRSLRALIDYALDIVESYPMLDYEKCYMTISC